MSQNASRDAFKRFNDENARSALKRSRDNFVRFTRESSRRFAEFTRQSNQWARDIAARNARIFRGK